MTEKLNRESPAEILISYVNHYRPEEWWIRFTPVAGGFRFVNFQLIPTDDECDLNGDNEGNGEDRDYEEDVFEDRVVSGRSDWRALVLFLATDEFLADEATLTSAAGIGESATEVFRLVFGNDQLKFWALTLSTLKDDLLDRFCSEFGTVVFPLVASELSRLGKEFYYELSMDPDTLSLVIEKAAEGGPLTAKRVEAAVTQWNQEEELRASIHASAREQTLGPLKPAIGSLMQAWSAQYAPVRSQAARMGKVIKSASLKIFVENYALKNGCLPTGTHQILCNVHNQNSTLRMYVDFNDLRRRVEA